MFGEVSLERVTPKFMCYQYLLKIFAEYDDFYFIKINTMQVVEMKSACDHDSKSWDSHKCECTKYNLVDKKQKL